VSELRKAAGAVVKTSAAMAKSANGLVGAASGVVPQPSAAGRGQSSGGRPRRKMRYLETGELEIQEMDAAVDERLAELEADERARRDDFELDR
jgi:hypothetical protein